ncbi:putative leader peptide [Streptomyces sp. NPDC047046]
MDQRTVLTRRRHVDLSRVSSAACRSTTGGMRTGRTR